MRHPSKILLARYKNRFPAEEKEEAEQRFRAAWGSAKIILDTMEDYFKDQLNRSIIEDEAIEITELAQPNVMYVYNKGVRANTRTILNSILNDKTLNLGED